MSKFFVLPCYFVDFLVWQFICHSFHIIYLLCINSIHSDAVVFRYNLSEEVEKARNLDVLLSKTKEQLTRKDAQYTEWVDAVTILNLSGNASYISKTFDPIDDSEQDCGNSSALAVELPQSCNKLSMYW